MAQMGSPPFSRSSGLNYTPTLPVHISSSRSSRGRGVEEVEALQQSRTVMNICAHPLERSRTPSSSGRSVQHQADLSHKGTGQLPTLARPSYQAADVDTDEYMYDSSIEVGSFCSETPKRNVCSPSLLSMELQSLQPVKSRPFVPSSPSPLSVPNTSGSSWIKRFCESPQPLRASLAGSVSTTTKSPAPDMVSLDLIDLGTQDVLGTSIPDAVIGSLYSTAFSQSSTLGSKHVGSRSYSESSTSVQEQANPPSKVEGVGLDDYIFDLEIEDLKSEDIHARWFYYKMKDRKNSNGTKHFDQAFSDDGVYSFRPPNVFPDTERPGSKEASEEDTFFLKMQERLPAFRSPRVEHAFAVAKDAHWRQLRKSGEPYVNHCVETAGILAELGFEEEIIVGAILHDTLDDTWVSVEYLRSEFGSDIADLVSEVSKLSQVNQLMRGRGSPLNRDELDSLNRMLLSFIKDVRVVLIKLADRLHNMRNISVLPREKQLRMARDTIDIIVPIASRLGIWQMKGELEDLCFEVLEPEAHQQLKRQLEASGASIASISGTIRALKQRLHELGISCDISGRMKNLHSIHKKMTKKGRALEEIFDVHAIRVIVDNVEDCYKVSEAVHALWIPLPTEYKDYIRSPKSNNYQSLHTAVRSSPDSERPFEVQIRTKEMHRVAEFGLAAHWRYKEQLAARSEFLDDKIRWLRAMLEWRQKIMQGAAEDLFADALCPFSAYSLQENVVVITAKGELLELAVGSSALDAARGMGLDTGRYCGVSVNGRSVHLTYHMQDGDVVDLLECAHMGEVPCGASFVPSKFVREPVKCALRS